MPALRARVEATPPHGAPHLPALQVGILGSTKVTSLMDAVRAFYAEKTSVKVPPFHEAQLYVSEEWSEFLEAAPGSEHEAKELADLVFTLAGYALAVGIDLDVAFRLVCESNMTKERTLSGKVQKGADYVEPDMREAMVR